MFFLIPTAENCNSSGSASLIRRQAGGRVTTRHRHSARVRRRKPALAWGPLRCGLLALALVAAAGFCATCHAQDYRVYTVVYDESGDATGGSAAEKDRAPLIVARSLTLAHAGKVYDSIDSIGEVIIFHPANRRFVILNTRRTLAATIEFDELKHLLKLARSATEEYASSLESRADQSNAETARALRFQLEPVFAEAYEPSQKELTLSSPHLRYAAQCADDRPAETVQSYLQYADWTCRLNYVLHPNVLLPEPRLALDEALRRRNLLPYVVVLQANGGGQLRLRAEHRYGWELGSQDRAQIHIWETLLEDPSVRRVSLRQYQAAMIKSEFGSVLPFRKRPPVE